MVTQSTLAMLDMKNMDEYYAYIIDSKINGQHKQSHELFNELSDSQQIAFFDWIEEAYFYEAEDNGEDMGSELYELKQYFRK